MNKAKALVLAIFALMFCASIAFAEDPAENKVPAVPEKMSEKQMGKEEMGRMAMQMMGAMQKQMVSTNDGGVIVWAGDKLFKYDKDLNLVKEVELKTGGEYSVVLPIFTTKSAEFSLGLFIS